jgi:hypothetical protein
MVNEKYRVDLLLADTSTNATLISIQQKLNQWITTGQLVKYQSSVIGDKILFEVIRIKQQGE